MPATTLQTPSTVKNKKLIAWVNDMVGLCKPDQVYWCNGSEEEYNRLCDEMVASGTFIKLNQEKRPGCFLARSHPSDVARVEDHRLGAVAGANLRPLRIEHDRNRVMHLAIQRADPADDLRRVRLVRMRHVETHDVHAGLLQLLEHFIARRCRTDRADDLGASEFHRGAYAKGREG